jgi:UDP-3-O-[3-hydroxymyristoyl] N-acetylglucosamine deacetylase
MQTTIRSAATFTGTGLHSGRPATAVLRPAASGHGVVFRRTDIALGDTRVPARWDLVDQSPLCTRIVNGAGVSVSTIEHLMAALAGCGVHNVLIEIDGPEVPILDGSSAPFVRGILDRGVRPLDGEIDAIEILAPVTVETETGWARLSPADGLSMGFHIDFVDAAIGKQTRHIDLANGAFVRELCDSRTFCRRAEVEAMQANGLALGGIAGENAVVFDGEYVESGAGLRHEDEPVRHKMLDALGDLALAGAPILGHYEGHKAGHAMTNALLRALFARPDAWRRTRCDARTAARLPGAGVRPDASPAVA